MVQDDLDRVWGAFEVVFPGFERMDDGEEFLVIDLVILFGRGQGVGEIGGR